MLIPNLITRRLCSKGNSTNKLTHKIKELINNNFNRTTKFLRFSLNQIIKIILNRKLRLKIIKKKNQKNNLKTLKMIVKMVMI